MNKKIESHSAALNNKRIQMILIEIDQLAMTAGGSISFGSIQNYYNALEQLYINIKDVFEDRAEIKNQLIKVREEYHMSLDLIMTDSRAQTVLALHHLFRLCKKFNSNMITGLQAGLEYFYRTGTREIKGLMNIPFFEIRGSEVEDEEY